MNSRCFPALRSTTVILMFKITFSILDYVHANTVVRCMVNDCVVGKQGSSQKKIKEGWWFLDPSIFVVLTHSSDHIKENLL